MHINGTRYRTLWLDDDGDAIRIIDQTCLPHELATRRLATLADVAEAITTMRVRGAPLIGIAAAYGYALAARADAADAALDEARATLAATRPTAVNLAWALNRMERRVRALPTADRAAAAFVEAGAMAEEDVAACAAIGRHGAALLHAVAKARRGGRVNILTHCNAGWLACIDWGTALAPIYRAQEDGIALHVWVDETRPRNQGAALTAFELASAAVPHTLIADNAGGHLMQSGDVDLVLVGADRIAANGDAANKIGTYLKALAAFDNAVPFYVAAPLSTIDWTLAKGVGAIAIEHRAPREVTHVSGRLANGSIETVAIAGLGTPAANPAFDVTPARLITAIVSECGVHDATPSALADLKPDSLS